MINLYDSKETNFEHNGLVVLSDCISCTVIEELNGMHEAKIEHPIDERGKWKYLLEGNIVKIDSQFFRIYHKQKKLTSIFINLRHIYYDLLDNFLEDITLTNLSGAGALDLILTNTQYAHSFTSLSDVSTLANKHFVRKNVVEAIMGTDGLINNIGGELVRDNFNIKLLGARGLDRGVLVAYGKNVQGIEETLDTDGICTRLMPVGKDGLLLTEKYIDSIYIDNFSHPKIKVVELSDYETEGTLRVAGQEYIADNKIDIPQFNYKIDFLELSKTEEYKDYAVLERVYLGDTVTIKHNRLDINLKAKVIKITKNILTDRIEKIELGSFKPNLATTINNSIQEVKQDIVQVKSDYQKAIENATDLITGASGGNVVIRQNAEGQPYEILIMDTIDVMTALNVWCWNLGGFGYSSTGINGPYETAITMDGSIVGKFITALEITGEQITGGLITGALLKTSNTDSYVTIENQNVNLYVADKMQMKIGIDETWEYDKYPYMAFGPDCGNVLNMKNYIWYAQGSVAGQVGGRLTMKGAEALTLMSGGETTVNASGALYLHGNELFFNSDTDIINLPNGCFLECLTNRLILHANAGSYLDIRDTGTWLYAKDGTSKQL